MTTLTRAVKRKVSTLRSGDLVVTLTPEGMYLREPRRRTQYLLPYGVAYQVAAEMFGRAEKRRKAAEKKAKQAAKKAAGGA